MIGPIMQLRLKKFLGLPLTPIQDGVLETYHIVDRLNDSNWDQEFGDAIMDGAHYVKGVFKRIPQVVDVNGFDKNYQSTPIRKCCIGCHVAINFGIFEMEKDGLIHTYWDEGVDKLCSLFSMSSGDLEMLIHHNGGPLDPFYQNDDSDNGEWVWEVHPREVWKRMASA